MPNRNQKQLEEQDKTFTMTVDNWSHRLCGFQQAHAIFRANWHYVRSSDKQFRDFKQLSRLEERGVNVHNKMVKLEDVGVSLSKVDSNIISVLLLRTLIFTGIVSLFLVPNSPILVSVAAWISWTEMTVPVK